jgi:hypothetical protein
LCSLEKEVAEWEQIRDSGFPPPPSFFIYFALPFFPSPLILFAPNYLSSSPPSLAQKRSFFAGAFFYLFFTPLLPGLEVPSFSTEETKELEPASEEKGADQVDLFSFYEKV